MIVNVLPEFGYHDMLYIAWDSISFGCPTPWLPLFQALWNRTDIVRALCFKRWGKHQPLTRSISSMCESMCEVYPNQGIITMNIHTISFSIVCMYILILYTGREKYIYILYTTHLHFPQSAHAIRTIPHLDGKGHGYR